MKKIIIWALLLSLIGLTSCTDKATDTASEGGSAVVNTGSADANTASEEGSAVVNTPAEAVASE